MPGPTPGIGDPGYQYEQLTPIVNAFLGYRPTEEELEEFPFEIYRFIIKSLRDRDQDESIGGTKLLERFLKGPQEIWLNMFDAGTRLNTLFDPEEIDGEYLPSLARLVGFGNDLIDIIGTATEEELRKIVAGAIKFWRERWLDSGIETAIRMVTGNRFKVRDFFDFRFIVGETAIEEDLQNTDPNMLSVKTRNFFRQGTDGVSRFDATPYTFHSLGTLPKLDDVGGFIVVFDDVGTPSVNGFYKIVAVDINQEIWYTDVSDWFPRADSGLSWFIAFNYDENITEIRLVDEETGQGEVNRGLLEKLLEWQRPSGERFNVVYVDFMDLFQTPNDLGQWEDAPITSGALSGLVVLDGILVMRCEVPAGGGLVTNRPTADWSDIQWKTKAALGTSTGGITLACYWYDEADHIRVLIEYTGFGTGIVKLEEVVSGTPNLLGTWAHPSLNPETYWTYTIETYNLPAGTVSVRVFVDGNLAISATATPNYTSGNIALICPDGSEVRIAETELWQYPLDITRVGPNP
jgi:hypothetical protein